MRFDGYSSSIRIILTVTLPYIKKNTFFLFDSCQKYIRRYTIILKQRKKYLGIYVHTSKFSKFFKQYGVFKCCNSIKTLINYLTAGRFFFNIYDITNTRTHTHTQTIKTEHFYYLLVPRILKFLHLLEDEKIIFNIIS